MPGGHGTWPAALCAHRNVRVYLPESEDLAHRLARGDVLINLDADNSNRGMRRVVDRYFAKLQDAALLQMDEGTQGDPLRGTFGRIGLSRYWFYRLGGYDESFLQIGHQDGDLVWRARAMGLEHISSRTGGPTPIRNTMFEKAANTGKDTWHAMWRANEKSSRRNLQEGRLVANLQGWGAADVRINFNQMQSLSPVSPQFISIVLLSRSAMAVEWLIEHYSAMASVGELLLVNQNLSLEFAEMANSYPKVSVINVAADFRPFARLEAASLASFPAVLLTSDDVFLPEETLLGLHKAWFDDPDVVQAVTDGSFSGDTSTANAIAFSPGTLTTVSACVAALGYSSRLSGDVACTPSKGTEEVLLVHVTKTRPAGRTSSIRWPFMKLMIQDPRGAIAPRTAQP